MSSHPLAPQLPRLAATFAVAAGLVLLGHVLIGERAVHLGYDATFYTRMVEGPMDSVPSPFRFRVLVPWLARQLPVPPPTALLIISYVSLFGCYVVVMDSCRVIGLGLRESIFGVAAVWGSTWHLYYFWNPYLTDAFGLLMLAVMMWAVLTGTLLVFATASLIGVLAREGTAMLVPAWLVTRQWRATMLLAVCTIAVAVLPRLLMALSPGTTPAEPELLPNQPVVGPVGWIRQLHATWGIVWWLALAGGLCLEGPHAWRLGAVLASLLVGTVMASAFATDLGRMFGFLAPVLAVACAQLYAVLRRQDVILTVAVTIAVVVRWMFNAPDVVIVPTSWIAGWPRRVFVVAELLLGLAVVVRVVWKTDTRIDHASIAPE